ncbi:MAG: RimK/LysX family protein [Gammaproteobacteria bacterium]|nr:RimK/LysX family protein [Gammaproteobacteria bacterium]
MSDRQLTVGWREWVLLPELNLPPLKAKIDTGARSSCLHAFSLEPFLKGPETWIRFGMHPHQNNPNIEVFCEAKIVDKRFVTDSGGHREERYVISTLLELNKAQWPIEITLTNRDTMRFRMLLGRTAMKDKIFVNPGASYLLGRLGNRPIDLDCQENIN